jgi:actin-related protein 5
VELIRAREILFQPSLIGNNSAGLPELTNHVLNSLPAEVAQQMSNNVFVCGGHAVNTVADGSFGLKTRLYQELRQCRPADQTVCVYQASDSRHDAWRGAGLFARNAMNSNDFSAFVTRQQYDECGRHYLSEHHCSNWNSV